MRKDILPILAILSLFCLVPYAAHGQSEAERRMLAEFNRQCQILTQNPRAWREKGCGGTLRDTTAPSKRKKKHDLPPVGQNKESPPVQGTERSGLDPREGVSGAAVSRGEVLTPEEQARSVEEAQALEKEKAEEIQCDKPFEKPGNIEDVWWDRSGQLKKPKRTRKFLAQENEVCNNTGLLQRYSSLDCSEFDDRKKCVKYKQVLRRCKEGFSEHRNLQMIKALDLMIARRAKCGGLK